MGGVYGDSTDSCFWKRTSDMTWANSFDYCASDGIVPFANYTGRLAHIDTSQLWSDITIVYPTGGFWTGTISFTVTKSK